MDFLAEGRADETFALLGVFTALADIGPASCTTEPSQNGLP